MLYIATYQELGLESLKSRRWYKRLVFMLKIMNEKAPDYLINLIPKYEPTIRTRSNSIPSYKCRTNYFKYSFFPSTQNDWFKLDINVRNSESIFLFKCRLLSFIRPFRNSMYNIFDPRGLKFLTHLRLGLSHLNAHRFRHSFQDCLNPLCSCGLETEDTSHYLKHSHHFSNHLADFMNSVKSVCDNFESMSDNVKKNVLLYGDFRFDEFKNRFIKSNHNLYKNGFRDLFLIDKFINSVFQQ